MVSFHMSLSCFKLTSWPVILVSWCNNSASDAGFVKYAERSNASKASQRMVEVETIVVTCSKMLRLLRTKTATGRMLLVTCRFVTIKSHCLLFIAPFGVNQVEDMIRVCKSRLLSLAWMFKLLQISSPHIVWIFSCCPKLEWQLSLSQLHPQNHQQHIGLDHEPKVISLLEWPAESRHSGESHHDYLTGLSSSWQQRPMAWQVSRALWTAVFWRSAFFLASSGTLPHSKVRWIQHFKGRGQNHTQPYKIQINQHRTLPFLKGVHAIALRLSFFFLFSRRRFIFSAILPCERC